QKVATTIAAQTCAVPYYVHLTVDGLLKRQDAPCDAATTDDARAIVAARLADPDDPWQLLHYVDRLKDYYGDDAAVVKAGLDAIAVADAPLTFDELDGRLAAIGEPPSREHLHELVDLLGKDHYLAFPDGRIAFRLEILRRAWVAR